MSPPPEDGVPGTTVPDTGRLISWILEIPSEAAYVSTARLFAGAVARHFGIDEDAVDDLKLAVSEACNGAIRYRETESANRPIRIDVTTDGASLVFEIEDAIDPGASRPGVNTEDMIRGLSIELIQALFPNAGMIPGRGGGTNMRLSIPLDATEGESFDA
jgi:serine/threonine-protein kinase RsbW